MYLSLSGYPDFPDFSRKFLGWFLIIFFALVCGLWTFQSYFFIFTDILDDFASQDHHYFKKVLRIWYLGPALYKSFNEINKLFGQLSSSALFKILRKFGVVVQIILLSFL